MTKKIILIAVLFLSITQFANAQNNVGIGTSTPDPSAMLDVSSTTQGMLVPRMTAAQRALITTPATGLLVYQTDMTTGFYFYNGTAWTSLSGASGGQWTLTGTNLNNNNTGNVGVGSTTPLKQLEVGSTNNLPVIAVGHIGGFNDSNSGELHFEEDLDYTSSSCGIKFNYNGLTNNLHILGQCGTFDTIGRFNRAGSTNLNSLRLGPNYLSNPTGALTVDGNVQINGNVSITGSIAKGSGTFKIDHPQDPENKYLIHSFVESPEMMNVYSGNITTDANGYATVKLPSYFEAANKDFRYQLTVMGSFAQAIIKEKISNNSFVIQTNNPNVEVSWSVTGVRADKFADANRVVPELEKELKGTYLHPELYGKSKDKSEDSKATMLATEKLKAKNNDLDADK